MIVTFGDFVYLDRHDGIAIGKRVPVGSSLVGRYTLLSHIERLDFVAGRDQIVALIAAHLGVDPADMLERLSQAEGEYENPLIEDCWHGSQGPLYRLGKAEISIEELRGIEARIEAEAAARAAKQTHIARRRRQFQAVRSDVVLRMLAAGVPYRCVHPGCSVVVDLTVDHRLPLSKGGTDDLSNLQFMCAPHNSQKRDKT